ncbi:hypothetical protein IMZ48_07460 [Candidatus Bathyarchaeota archaeon]|nr:hypothetical protein [Candidatus Bathyarchaeota archaeon]
MDEHIPGVPWRSLGVGRRHTRRRSASARKPQGRGEVISPRPRTQNIGGFQAARRALPETRLGTRKTGSAAGAPLLLAGRGIIRVGDATRTWRPGPFSLKRGPFTEVSVASSLMVRGRDTGWEVGSDGASLGDRSIAGLGTKGEGRLGAGGVGRF